MKLVMVNDCAYVAETLIKYLPSTVGAVHLKRSRRFLDKTLRIAWNILKANADVYHVNYLLQDCYLTLRFRKRPVVGHAHGSDLRNTLEHPVWGRIVRYNLSNCDKVLVSTPDILGQAKAFREDARYLPNPVDTQLFYPKPILEHDGKKRVLIASDSNWRVKGTDMIVRALSKIKDEVDVSIIEYGVDFERTLALASSLDLHPKVLPKVTHEMLNEYYWDADIVIGGLNLGILGLVSLEAIACGRPVIAHVSSEYSEYRDFPLKDVKKEEISSVISDANEELWRQENTYLRKNHDPHLISDKLRSIYKEVIS